jgi:hypothetical protein
MKEVEQLALGGIPHLRQADAIAAAHPQAAKLRLAGGNNLNYSACNGL